MDLQLDTCGLESQAELLGLFGDITRLRLLHVLSSHELSVGELVQVTELGQSRVSTHLGKLREHRLVLDRKAGTSTYYRFNGHDLKPGARRLWDALKDHVEDKLVRQDLRRAEQAVEARRGQWPENLAGEMERHYSPGRTWDTLARAVTGLLDLGDVLDIGTGDGTVAELLAPHARSITCLDLRPRLLAAARRRLQAEQNVRFLRGDMHTLPCATRSFDHVLLLNALVHAARPHLVLAEASRVLRAGGTLVLVTLQTHGYVEEAGQYGHLQRGFSPSFLRAELEHLDLHVRRCEVTSRERRRPHFQVITCFAQRPKGCS